MHINCLACGHRFDIGRAYDDYEGLVRCSTCRSLLDIRTQEGQVRAVRPANLPIRPADAAASQGAPGAPPLKSAA